MFSKKKDLFFTQYRCFFSQDPEKPLENTVGKGEIAGIHCYVYMITELNGITGNITKDSNTEEFQQVLQCNSSK